MFIRGLVSAIIGILGGSPAGALTFGWDASMFAGSSFIGPTRDWWPVHALVGALGGAVFGLILGLFISLANLGKVPSAIVGCIVGMIGVIAMLSVGEGSAFWELRSVISRVAPLILSFLIWTLLGLLLSAAASKLSKIEGGDPVPTARHHNSLNRTRY